MYKKANNLLMCQNKKMKEKCALVVCQLQSLFDFYNKQKKRVEQLENFRNNFERELMQARNRIEDLEQKNNVERESHNREIELIVVRHKATVEELQCKLQEMSRYLSLLEDEKHNLAISEIDLKDKLRLTQTKLGDTEQTLNAVKTKLGHEVLVLQQQKEELLKYVHSLEQKLNATQRNYEIIERDTRKELAQTLYTNEELSMELEKLRRKYEGTSKREYQKTSASGNKRHIEEEGMIKNFTAQILEKDEVKNANVVAMFKLDQIKVDEYKNLLRAMGALYFANKYSKVASLLLNHWRNQLQRKKRGK